MNEVHLERYLPTRSELSVILKKIGDEFVERFIDIIKNRQETWTGKRLSRNEESTLKRKRRMGWGEDTLIAEYKDFINPDNWQITVSGNEIHVKMINELAKKLGWVGRWARIKKKNYDKVMPNLDIKKEAQWFENRLFEEIYKKIEEKIRRI